MQGKSIEIKRNGLKQKPMNNQANTFEHLGTLLKFSKHFIDSYKIFKHSPPARRRRETKHSLEHEDQTFKDLD